MEITNDTIFTLFPKQILVGKLLWVRVAQSVQWDCCEDDDHLELFEAILKPLSQLCLNWKSQVSQLQLNN